MSTKQVVTEASLSEIKYHELKGELEKLGLASCWVQGKKKVDIIKDAIAKLGTVTQLQEINLTQHQIDQRLALKDAEKAAAAQKKVDDAIIEQKQLDKAQALKEAQNVTKQIVDSKTNHVEKVIDVARLYRSLQLTRANIKGGPTNHIPKLRRREHHLIDLLQKAGEKID